MLMPGNFEHPEFGLARECFGCKTIKPRTEQFWYRASKSTDGFQRECKECTDRRRVRAEWWKTDKGKSYIKSYQGTPEAREKRLAKYRQNRSHFAEITRKSQIKRRGTLHGHIHFMLWMIRAKSKSRQLQFNLTTEWLVDLYRNQKGLCALTGEVMTYIAGKGFVQSNVSVDRINPKGGYTMDNVQLTCLFANTLKGGRTMERLVELCGKILRRYGEMMEDTTEAA